jgi:hypothetical protein
VYIHVSVTSDHRWLLLLLQFLVRLGMYFIAASVDSELDFSHFGNVVNYYLIRCGCKLLRRQFSNSY